MKIIIKFPGVLKSKGIGLNEIIEAEESITLRELFEQVGLAVIEQKELVVVVNNKHARLNQKLKDGDEIVILSVIAGG